MNTVVKSRSGNKRLALLLVLKALEQMSDEHHPIKQVHLAKMVNDLGGLMDLDIWCDRKTVGRHIKLLIAAGYKIVTIIGKGCYLDGGKFTKQESIAVSKIIKESGLPDDQKEQILKKLIVQQINLDKDILRKNL